MMNHFIGTLFAFYNSNVWFYPLFLEYLVYGFFFYFLLRQVEYGFHLVKWGLSQFRHWLASYFHNFCATIAFSYFADKIVC